MPKFTTNHRKASGPPKAFYLPDSDAPEVLADPWLAVCHRSPEYLLPLSVGDRWLHGDAEHRYEVLAVVHDDVDGDSKVTIAVDGEATTFRVSADTMLTGMTTSQIAGAVRKWRAAAKMTTPK